MIAKRIAVVGFAAVLAMAITGCSSDSSDSGDGGQEPEQAGQSQAAAASSDYVVEIGGSTLGEDYEGNPVLIVDFTWTNNSDKAATFLVSIDAAAFQDGVELETAIGSGIDSMDTMKEIKPGATQSVQCAYVLDGQSDVTIECTELISFDDTILASKVFSVA